MGAEYRLFVTKLYTILGAGRTHFQSVNFITPAPTLRHPVESHRIESSPALRPPKHTRTPAVCTCIRCRAANFVAFLLSRGQLAQRQQFCKKTCLPSVFQSVSSLCFLQIKAQSWKMWKQCRAIEKPVSTHSHRFWVHANHSGKVNRAISAILCDAQK